MLLKKGMYNNNDVQNMQHKLMAIGYTIDVDGDFGSGTDKIVRNFQGDNQLFVDGIAGMHTLRTLRAFYNSVVGSDLYEDDLVGVEPEQNFEQPWMVLAVSQKGIHEVRDEPVVQNYWRQAKLSGLAKYSASGIPWCSGFCCAMFEEVGIRSARTDGAKNWLKWGQELTTPVDGCIVVFTRDGGGHVGFITGEDTKGNLLVLSGNQGDAVNIKSFDKGRVTGYRYPSNMVVPNTLTVGGVPTKLSDNES